MRAMRSDRSVDSIKTKLKQLRRGTPKSFTSTERNGRKRDNAADSERAPSAQLTGHVALNAVADVACRSPIEVLQARPCAEDDGGKLPRKVALLPSRAAARGQALGPWQTAVEASDLTYIVFSDEKFFRWNYQGLVHNIPIFW